MRSLRLSCSALLAFVFIGFLSIAPISLSAAAAAPGGEPRREAVAHEIENFVEQFAGLTPEEPVFTELGDGFYSLSITLSQGIRERLLEAMRSHEITETQKAQSLFVISVGQAPVLPPNPITTTHGALSDTTFPYTYWIITVNLGAQTVTKSTTLKLSGPGLKFKRSINVVYGANGIWGIGYSPGGGVRTPGIYTLQGTVKDGGSITTKSFAINP